MHYCRFCGSKVPMDAMFCPYCGRVIRDIEDITVPTERGNHESDTPTILTNPPQIPLVDPQRKPQIASDPIIAPSLEKRRAEDPQLPVELHTVHQTAKAEPFTYQPLQNVPLLRQALSSRHFVTSFQHSATRIITNKKARWIIPLVAAILLLSVSGIFLIEENQPPNLTVIGSAAVPLGNTLHVHGTGFLPNGRVVLKLEDGQVLFPYNGVRQTAHSTTTSARSLNGLMSVAGSLLPKTLTSTTIPVNAIGSFDVIIAVDANWEIGQHTIHATEDLGARSAELQFTITPKPARLVVNPTMLDFGNIAIGRKVFLAVRVGNAGGTPLTWVADTKGTVWLTPKPATGTIQAGNLTQTIAIAADTTHLKGGNYSATLRFSSSGGEVQIAVKLTVVPPGQPQTRMILSPDILDFGNQSLGTQSTLPLTISNVGTQILHWKVSTGNTKWVTLNSTSGTISPGGLPQTIYVTADTKTLSVGAYASTLQFTSNGGNAKPGIKLAVISAPFPSPSPYSYPTAVPTRVHSASLGVSPSSLNATNDCSYTQNQGWDCLVRLSNSYSAETSLNWTASGSAISGITFYPKRGTLLPGQVAHVNVLIPDMTCSARANAILTFTGPSNTTNIAWHCPATQSALVVGPMTFHANTDCTFGTSATGQGWICSATLISKGTQRNLNWSVTSRGVAGVSIWPAKGTLPPGSSAQIDIVIPNIACPASASFTFLGASTPTVATWSCVPPKLTASPDTFTNGCILCTVTLGLATGEQGSVQWKADSSGINGVRFTPSHGTVSAGKPVQVTISVPDTDCQDAARFTFTGAANAVRVPWHCATDATLLTVSPTTFVAGSATCPSSGAGWNCTASLAPSAGSQHSIPWSIASDLQQVSISQANGALVPGQVGQVTIFIPAKDCYESSFNFAGLTNTLSVPWSCVKPPTLTIGSNSTIDANSDCLGGQFQVWNCSIELSSDPHNQSASNWSASSSNAGVYFSPSSGAVAPGQTEEVNVTLSSMACPTTTTLSFTETDSGNTSLVPWSCAAPPLLTVSANNFNANSDCPVSYGGWTCTTTVSLAAGSTSALNWSASSGLAGVIFTPSSGTLVTGQSTQVNIYIPNGDCQNGTFSFMGAVNSANGSWGCVPPPLLYASSGNCSYTVGQGWICAATVSSDAYNQSTLTWSANQINGVSFNPSSGTLAPGQSAQVSIAIGDMPCPANANFTFTGSGGATPASLSWNCVAPMMAVSSGVTCPSDGYGNYTCTFAMALIDGSQGDLNWSIYNGLSGVTFNQSSGMLVPGQVIYVNATVLASDCPGGSFDFTDNAGNVYPTSWTCEMPTPTPPPTDTPTATPTDTPTATPTDTPTTPPSAPTLVLSPTSFDASNCTQNGDGSWTCYATLSLDPSASTSVNWTANSSFSDVNFYPQYGSLTPGSQVSVTITIPATDCSNGTFNFTTDGGNITSASWSCTPPTATPTDTPTATPTDTPTATPTDTPTPIPSDTPTDTPTPIPPTDTPTAIPSASPT